MLLLPLQPIQTVCSDTYMETENVGLLGLNTEACEHLNQATKIYLLSERSSLIAFYDL